MKEVILTDQITDTAEATGEPYNQLEALRKHNTNQRRELARLNQRLNYIGLGAQAATLKGHLVSAYQSCTVTRTKYTEAHNQALAVMAATMAAIDNTDRFSEAVNDKFADVVKLCQETRVNLDNTLEALQHILEMAKVVTDA